MKRKQLHRKPQKDILSRFDYWFYSAISLLISALCFTSNNYQPWLSIAGALFFAFCVKLLITADSLNKKKTRTKN